MESKLKRSFSNGFNANKFSVVALCLFLCLPIFQSLPNIIRIAYVIVFFLLYFVTVSANKMSKIIIQVLYIFLFISGNYVVLNIEISFYQYVFIGFWFWIPFIIMIDFSRYDNPHFKKIFINILLIISLVTSITTVIGLLQFPFASRELATGRNNIYPLKVYYSRNIGGYGFIYGIVLMLPILIGDFRFNVIRKELRILCLVLFYFSIILSKYTIALILSIALPSLILLRFRKGSILSHYSHSNFTFTNRVFDYILE